MPVDHRVALTRSPGTVRAASDVLVSARERERAGCVREAMERYEAAIGQAEQGGELTILAEALRRFSVMLHQQGERERARELCNRSLDLAGRLANDLLVAEALNTLGAMLWHEGELPAARETLVRALSFGGTNSALRARVEQNLGVVANIRGDLDEARTRYESSLREYQSAGDEHGSAIAFHNLGIVSLHQRLFNDAERYLQQSLDIAERAGDLRLKGLSMLNQADVHIARQRYDEARRNAEAALVMFDQLGARDHKASAYRVIGVVYRETGRPALAESRLRSAIEMSADTGSLLGEADATQELAVLYQQMGRNADALSHLWAAHQLFTRLDARIDLVNVDEKLSALEATYRAVVREWGQSIESSDTYTFGHCERVAQNSVALAGAMGLSVQEVTTIRLGAYLHDVGKVRVPHEILNKAGPLTSDELEVVQMHTVWGVELLADVEFPWDLKPIIRWHHERYDGSGYPDRLRADEIPLPAQIVGITDVYDALTTTRAYRAARSHEAALEEMRRTRSWWSAEVFEAFERAFGRGAPDGVPRERHAGTSQSLP
jgi:putative nucleotidyltransferase with HDIG domain